jgi:GNAT superfamily N-acetyltransferase
MSDLVYKVIDKTATTPVCQLLLESFFRDEPLGLALGLTTNEVSRWLPGYVESILEEPVSLGVFSNEVLIGVCINIVESHPSLISCIDQELEPAMYEVARFLQKLNQGMNLERELNLEPGSKILTTLFLNVNSGYGGKGIAAALALKAEELARNSGAVAVQVDTTSDFSYRVYSKLGYRVLRTLDYADLKHDLTGSQVIDQIRIGPIHTCGRALAKILTGSNNSKED